MYIMQMVSFAIAVFSVMVAYWISLNQTIVNPNPSFIH